MYRLMLRIVLFFLISGVPAIQASPEKIKILSTIKPVQLIVSAIAGDNAELEQIIPDYSSPHHYSFKPSDISRIKNADIVFRIDEHLESVLSPVLEQMVPKEKLISLAEVDDIHFLKIEAKGHQHSHIAHDAEEIDKEEVDLHIWPSPKNSLVMAKAIALYLSKIDPQNAAIYQENFAQFELGISNSNKKIELQMKDVKGKQYITFHNSWHYFSEYFGLRDPIIINSHEGLGGDTKSILEIRKKIKKDKIGCVVSDTNTSVARIKTIIEGIQVNTAQVDVLGSTLSKKEDESRATYIYWLEDMANTVYNCLK